MFNENEIRLLDVAYKTLLSRMHILEVLGNPKWENTGIEYWVQTEMIVGLDDEGFKPETVGKVKENCDILLKSSNPPIRLEIEAVTNLDTRYVSGNIQEHMNRDPKPDLFLFLGKSEIPELCNFYKFLDESGYEEIHETLLKGWILMLLKKAHNP